jgi:hypothetical protein
MVVAALIAFDFSLIFILMGGLTYMSWMAILTVIAARRHKRDVRLRH